MDKTYSYLLVEDIKDSVTTLHPITIKIDYSTFATWNDLKSTITPRLEYSLGLPFYHLKAADPHDKTFVVIGTGRTLYSSVDNLDKIKQDNNVICSLNRAHEFLIKRYVIPDIHIFYERDLPSIERSLGGPPHKDVTYYISSSCNQHLFEQLNGYKIVIWNDNIPNNDYHQIILSKYPEDHFIGVGPTSFLKSFGIAELIGYRNFEFYGIDCSFPLLGPDHIDEYETNDPESKFYLWGKNSKTGELRKYFTNLSLMLQSMDFVEYCKEHKDLNVKIHGEGLLGFIYE